MVSQSKEKIKSTYNKLFNKKTKKNTKNRRSQILQIAKKQVIWKKNFNIEM